MRLIVAISLVLACAGAVVAEELDLHVGALASSDSAEWAKEHPMRTSTRHEDALDHDMADRASLMFRAMDKNHDRKISEADIRASEKELEQHMPGITVPEFLEFVENGDKDHDQALSRDELIQALADGIENAEQEEMEQNEPAAGLIEMDSSANMKARQRRKGFFGKIGNAIKTGAKKVWNFGKKLLGGAVKNKAQQVAGIIDKSQDGCVMCQYIVERCETNVKQSGVIPGMAQVVDPATIFLETEAKVAQKQVNYDFMAANIIGSTRQSTRVQRQMERQKYNEIYRVVDITLDDVCEQGMPNRFYAYCKQVYKVQSDVVDGLRYQYRPTDICFRIGMCGKDSYITQGIHSRYK
jgi:Ca2+-binding EF-hand superfamily protein